MFYGGIMKRIFIAVFLCLFGLTIYAQNLSSYRDSFMRTDNTFAERLIILESMSDAGITGAAEFYHEALEAVLNRVPDIRTRTEQDAAERCAVFLSQALGAERLTAAAPDLWRSVVTFDVVRDAIEGNAMQAALIALGQVEGRDFIPQIIQRLNDFNAQTVRNAEARRRVQMGVIGCITALETLQDISGYRPVFFASINGGYDPAVRQIAADALPNIADDPGEIIGEIIHDPSIDPSVKIVAWRELLRSRAPGPSRANVAAIALATGWNYVTSNRGFQGNLSEMRKSAIDVIREFGVTDESVYVNLERSYSSNFNNNSPDYDEIMLTLNALAAIRSEEAVELLHRFLADLHNRRQRGVWGDKERRVFPWIISCIAVTGTRSEDVRLLLSTIQRTATYTPHEQGLARNALGQLPN
jgi:HEAT repeat protein